MISADFRPGIAAVATALPANRVTNADLERAHPDWNLQRVAERTGVYARPVAGPGVTALDLAEQACRRLTEEGHLALDEVDALIFCTETPDYPLPPNACVLHGRLDLPAGVMAFDITLACSGYVYGLQLARSLIVAGTARTVLLVTADTYSRLIHPGDRAIRCLFGDGAAASVIRALGSGRGIIDIAVGTQGKVHDRFIVPAGGMRRPRSPDTATEVTDRSGNVRTAEHIAMDGLGVISFFNAVVPPQVRGLLEANGARMADVSAVIFHQASRLTVEALAQALAVAPGQLVSTLAETGNLVSASIPVALRTALDDGRVAQGDLVLLCGFGVGLSWATALLRL